MNEGQLPQPPRETNSPSGIDLRPQPEKPLRISRRAAGLIVLIGLSIAGLFAYGGARRRHQEIVAADETPLKKVEPARPDEIQQVLKPASVNKTEHLHEAVHGPHQLQTPRPDLPNEGTVVRRVSPPPPPGAPVNSAAVVHEPTAEQRALSAAYVTEQRARLAPTSIRTESADMTGSPPSDRVSGIPAADNGIAQLGAIANALASRSPSMTGSSVAGAANANSEYDGQNLQSQKESFVEKALAGSTTEGYLKSIRTPPLSRFEIKAGWEIPAVLDQELNSDLPGELKALVMSNVYDTATGQYLLVPQGARLVGAYNSRVGYGQNGVQVVWRRLIFPDGSAIDLNGMEGLDAQGNAGLRGKVDHHYKQLLGFAVLSSMFDAALAVTQNRQQDILAYPSTTQEMESAAGREVSQLGSQVTRKNLNVQPTIRIPAGYKFNVRVNRDILFEEPYTPTQPAVKTRW
jgi:type IV secretion system protein VirB10